MSRPTSRPTTPITRPSSRGSDGCRVSRPGRTSPIDRRASRGSAASRGSPPLSSGRTTRGEIGAWGLQHASLVSYPRKYWKGSLGDAYKRNQLKTAPIEYTSTCGSLGAEPNSFICDILVEDGAPVASAFLLGGKTISLRNTYVGERGFIALLPLLDRNTYWTSLDASNNGLRNEAVLHLVDLLLQPQHMGRPINLDLSRNPISETAARALLELVQCNPSVESVTLGMTKVPRRSIFKLQNILDARKFQRIAEAAAQQCEREEQEAEEQALVEEEGDGDGVVGAEGKLQAGGPDQSPPPTTTVAMDAGDTSTVVGASSDN